LTTSSVHFKAASITDGTFRGYMQYLQNADFGNADLSRASDAAIGAQPFGGGLQEWLKRAPAFNLDKVAAPLQIVAEGRESVLFMWEAYAALWFQKKPVDLLVLNLDEHILTNPASRLASQGGSVDWFRFWLQDYEDPDPGKTQQYRRWEELRKMTGVVAPNGGGVGGERPEFK